MYIFCWFYFQQQNRRNQIMAKMDLDEGMGLRNAGSCSFIYFRTQCTFNVHSILFGQLSGTFSCGAFVWLWAMSRAHCVYMIDRIMNYLVQTQQPPAAQSATSAQVNAVLSFEYTSWAILTMALRCGCGVKEIQWGFNLQSKNPQHPKCLWEASKADSAVWCLLTLKVSLVMRLQIAICSNGAFVVQICTKASSLIIY